MLLVFGVHGNGRAQIVALRAGAQFDVFFGGVRRVGLHGFQDFGGKIGVVCAHDFQVEVGGEGNQRGFGLFVRVVALCGHNRKSLWGVKERFQAA